jgi:hypothetical protein
MRSVREYLERAVEFETLAAAATVDVSKKRYGDIAANYRLLAKEREWLIGTGAIESDWSIGGASGRRDRDQAGDTSADAG